MKTFEQILSQYHYKLPESAIAQEPALPRDRAKLLVYDRKSKQTQFDIFGNLDKYLPRNSLLIFNDTKVVPARLKGKKETGGRIEIFFLGIKRGKVEALLSPRPGAGKKIYLTPKYWFTGLEQKQKIFLLKPNFPVGKIYSLMEKLGSMPLPPYIKHSPLSEAEKRKYYQTVFAHLLGSVAAPTASLHFTKRLLKKLTKAGHQIGFITLQVNLGTFAPLEEDNFTQNRLHEEWYYIPQKTIQLIKQARQNKQPIIACGTTVVRALESAYRAGIKTNELRIMGSGWRTTGLFIKPPYKFKVINGLVTNFHLPKSSLLMLVASLTGRKEILDLYQKALQEGFRFYSFGDGMLIKE